MMRDRDDLKAQRQHVGRKPRLDHRGGIDAFLLEMLQALVEVAADGAKDLEVVCYGRVVERKGHGTGFPLLCVFDARHSFRKLRKRQLAPPRMSPQSLSGHCWFIT